MQNFPWTAPPLWDLCPRFDELAANVILQFLFGETISSVDQGFIEALHAAQKGCERRWLLGVIADLVPYRGFAGNVAVVHACMSGYVERALQQKETVGEQQNFVQQLIRNSEYKQFIRDELLTLLIAGLDTVGALLTNLFFLLAKHPECWRELRKEVAHLGGSSPSFQQSKDLKYTRYCINEGTFHLFDLETLVG